jgi:hypothetical protein
MPSAGAVITTVGAVGSGAGAWNATTSCAAVPAPASRDTKSTRPLIVSSVFLISHPSFAAPASIAPTSAVTSKSTVPARLRVISAVAVALPANVPPFHATAQSGRLLSRFVSAGQSHVAAPSDHGTVTAYAPTVRPAAPQLFAFAAIDISSCADTSWPPLPAGPSAAASGDRSKLTRARLGPLFATRSLAARPCSLSGALAVRNVSAATWSVTLPAPGPITS